MFRIGIIELIIIIFVLVVIIGGILLTRALIKSPNDSKNQSNRLKELQKMRTDGLITDDEYNEKRKEILNSL